MSVLFVFFFVHVRVCDYVPSQQDNKITLTFLTIGNTIVLSIPLYSTPRIYATHVRCCPILSENNGKPLKLQCYLQ